MISNEQISACKTALMERQNQLIEHLKDHFGFEQEFVKESLGELSNYDNHPADHGTALFERGKDLALNEHMENELEKINEALHAIDQGTYGICSKCGRDIPFERLQAVPTTAVCIEHADDNTFKRRRPVEEEVFSPNINPDEVTPEEQVGYDAEDAWQDVARYGTSDTPSDLYGDQDDYNEMFVNSDERIGATEDIEEFLAADSHGKFTGVAPNHNQYEEERDR